MGKIRDDQPVSTRPLPATPGWSDPASWAREDGSGSFAPLLEAFVPGGGPGGAGVQKQAPPPGVTPGGRIGPPTYVPLPGGAAVPDPGELGRPGGAIRVPPLPPNAIISGQIQDALGAKPQDTRLAILDGLVARGRADVYVPLSGHTYAIGYDRTTGQLSLADPERPDAKHPWMSLHDLARRLHIDPDDLDPNRHASLKTALLTDFSKAPAGGKHGVIAPERERTDEVRRQQGKNEIVRFRRPGQGDGQPPSGGGNGGGGDDNVERRACRLNVSYPEVMPGGGGAQTTTEVTAIRKIGSRPAEIDYSAEVEARAHIATVDGQGRLLTHEVREPGPGETKPHGYTQATAGLPIDNEGQEFRATGDGKCVWNKPERMEVQAEPAPGDTNTHFGRPR